MLDLATAVVERLFVGPNPRISPIFACPILKFDHASARCVGRFQIIGRVFVNLANRHSGGSFRCVCLVQSFRLRFHVVDFGMDDRCSIDCLLPELFSKQIQLDGDLLRRSSCKLYRPEVASNVRSKAQSACPQAPG